MTPTGTLTKKIHSPPMLSTSAPPANGPTRLATLATVPHAPSATPRR
ncbi:Uncharacterised protein [Mycobacterium tuberculosis]|nr:Uncharacterised protein [Mycobacterium tuberculosis]